MIMLQGSGQGGGSVNNLTILTPCTSDVHVDMWTVKGRSVEGDHNKGNSRSCTCTAFSCSQCQRLRPDARHFANGMVVQAVKFQVAQF